MNLFVILAAVCATSYAQTPVRLKPYPQAQRTLYSLKDAGVPAALSGKSVLQVSGVGGAAWRGTSHGVWREDPKAGPGDRKRYFASRRWLPDDRVVSLHADSSGGMWVRTETGVSHIEFHPMTLARKTVPFEVRVQQRHNRHGMVADSSLLEPGNLASNQKRSSDNDGLWTAMYAVAQCFRYAVTRSPEALRFARQATEAVLRLEQITGRPGYPARSIVLPEEPRPRDGVWHWTPDGKLLWKSDTSSDEIVGHFFLFSAAWDLIPDPDLRQRLSATTRRIMDHILDNHLTLTDIHGSPTYWGRWDSEYFQTRRGKPDSPLNSLEILSFLKTAHHITSEPRFEQQYRRLADDLGYAALTERYIELRGPSINYSDEELAMLSFYPLLKYEKDPKLLQHYRKALQAWWQNMERQKNPLWIFIYAAGLPGAKVRFEDAVWTLQRIPMDLVNWTIANSHRDDIQLEPQPDRFGRRQAITLLPPDERPVMKWNGNPFRIDGGSGGTGEDDGAFFLLPYWMGRYHRFLAGE